MDKEEIGRLYIPFCEWVEKEYGYFAVDGEYLIKLWYEFLIDECNYDPTEI